MLTGMVTNWEMFRDVTGHAFEGHKRLAIIQFCLLLEGWDEANKVLWGMGEWWMFTSPASPSHLNVKFGGSS